MGDGAGEQVGVDSIGDERKVARLQPVAKDLRSHAFANALCKERDDRRIRRVMALSGAEDIEVAQAHGFQSVTVAPRTHQVLTSEFGVRVRR